MEEIEVGEYVRTISGNIDKVDALYGMIENTVHLENHKWQSIKNIVKHSPNLIDLIEVGDYVNGYRVKETGIYTEKEVVEIYAVCHNLKEIENKLVNKKWYILDNDYLMPLRNCKNDSIKSVITKEQMASIEYKVEEDKQYAKDKR